MVRDELRNLVKFDANQLREAIRSCDQEALDLAKKREEVMALAALYRQILLIHGHREEPDVSFHMPSVKADVSMPSGPDRRFRNMKLGDAIVTALSEHGGKLHAKRIIELLVAGGLRVGKKYPMSTLITAITRDERIEKDPIERNTWRLKTAT